MHKNIQLYSLACQLPTNRQHLTPGSCLFQLHSKQYKYSRLY